MMASLIIYEGTAYLKMAVFWVVASCSLVEEGET
jgi:hypothetical protein